ncbi:MAG: hypothetical protein FJ218_09505 [Ignavibacteria bacterium]|nr:hypothetical protein [Ignavibacteria bacterium]
MRRNILTYKAPPNNEGYDLICIHPNPRKTKKQIRIQVKSRYQTDCDRGFPVKEKSFSAFDYVIVAFLNIGYFMGKYKKGSPSKIGMQNVEFYTLPLKFIRKHHDKSSTWEKVRIKNIDVERYKNERGFELIAKDLGIDYPNK